MRPVAQLPRAVEHSARARQCPEVYVIAPERLTAAKDPDELAARTRREARAARNASLRYRLARARTRGYHADLPTRERRAALARAGRWHGTLPPRLAIEPCEPSYRRY
jgi:hypothetical protein